MALNSQGKLLGSVKVEIVMNHQEEEIERKIIEQKFGGVRTRRLIVIVEDGFKSV